MGLFARRQLDTRYFDRAEEIHKMLALYKGELEAASERLDIAKDYETAQKQLTDAEIKLAKLKEDHARENREIEHKLGLHKIQVEQERAAAVQEAKLAVREEALSAQEGRFKQEMEFMQSRFESEVQSQRKLVEQVLSRLPHFTHNRVEHIGTDPSPSVKLELTQGE